MYYIGGHRTHNGIGTIQYIPVLGLCLSRVYTSNENLRRIRRTFCARGARILGHQCRSTP